jgi:hypothetical protein
MELSVARIDVGRCHLCQCERVRAARLLALSAETRRAADCPAAVVAPAHRETHSTLATGFVVDR